MPPNGKGKGKSRTSGEPSALPVPQETPPPVESLDSDFRVVRNNRTEEGESGRKNSMPGQMSAKAYSGKVLAEPSYLLRQDPATL